MRILFTRTEDGSGAVDSYAARVSFISASSPDEETPRTGAQAWMAHPSYGAVPRLSLTNRGEACSRLVVVAAHPDDESLGAGGLIASAADAGLSVYVVLLTAGEASPYAPRSKTRHALATLRLAEMENALARLAPDNDLVFLGAPDGGVHEAEDQIARSLTGLLGEATHTLLAAPWREDGHPDHDAAGRASALAAQASGARLVEFPLLAWTHRRPDDLSWDEVVCLELSAQSQARKAAAISAHESQVRPVGRGPGAPSPLSERVLAHFHSPVEHYLEAPEPEAPDPESPDPPA